MHVLHSLALQAVAALTGDGSMDTSGVCDLVGPDSECSTQLPEALDVLSITAAMGTQDAKAACWPLLQQVLFDWNVNKPDAPPAPPRQGDLDQPNGRYNWWEDPNRHGHGPRVSSGHDLGRAGGLPHQLAPTCLSKGYGDHRACRGPGATIKSLRDS